jgi:hypothetical protein
VHEFLEDLFDLLYLYWLTSQNNSIATHGDGGIELILDQLKICLIGSEEFNDINVGELYLLFNDVHAFVGSLVNEEGKLHNKKKGPESGPFYYAYISFVER